MLREACSHSGIGAPRSHPRTDCIDPAILLLADPEPSPVLLCNDSYGWPNAKFGLAIPRRPYGRAAREPASSGSPHPRIGRRRRGWRRRPGGVVRSLRRLGSPLHEDFWLSVCPACSPIVASRLPVALPDLRQPVSHARDETDELQSCIEPHLNIETTAPNDPQK